MTDYNLEWAKSRIVSAIEYLEEPDVEMAAFVLRDIAINMPEELPDTLVELLWTMGSGRYVVSSNDVWGVIGDIREAFGLLPRCPNCVEGFMHPRVAKVEGLQREIRACKCRKCGTTISEA